MSSDTTNSPENTGSTENTDVQEFWHQLSKHHIVMLTDVFSGGLRARPMGAITRIEEGLIWFMTDRDSAKVDEVEANPEVNLSIADAAANLYISITGHCSVVDDRSKIEELWSPPHKAFFDGPDDSRIVLLRVTPDQGQMWSGPAGPIAAAKMMFAALTGNKPDLGTTTKVAL